jgi:hypothetical protein
MIALPHPPDACTTTDWQAGFLQMLPTLERYARFAFRRLRREAREDAICETIANCLCVYRRLYKRNELHRAFASPLVRYAVAQYHVGRRVGTSWCARDVYSTRARRDGGIEIHSLGTSSEQREEWLDCLTDNRRTPVPDQAHFRLEFPRWLGTQTNRNRQIAETLAFGYSTGEVARKFNISSGRVSQIRRELYESWNEFNGERQPVSAGWSHTKVAPPN